MSVTLRRPGTYILLIEISRRSQIAIGRNLRPVFEPGLYAYVGSALGPGGLAARLKRHAAGAGRRHWHIDYLMPHGNLLGALVRADGKRRECAWAARLAKASQSRVDGFGASDCRCGSHLFCLGRTSKKDRFLEQTEKILLARRISKAELSGGNKTTG